MAIPGACRALVVVPHFFHEGNQTTAYGSTRAGNRMARTVALARCLGGVLALARQPCDLVLNMAHEQLEATPQRSQGQGVWALQELQIELHVFVTADAYLAEVLESFGERLTVHHLGLQDPRQLPLAAVHWLLQQEPVAALNVYLEDDLVIGDPHFLDKQLWFAQRTEDRFVLMPHRRETAVRNAPLRLYVDGPLRMPGEEGELWAADEADVASGRFWDGSEVGFVRSLNPHSGSFCLSAAQLRQRREQPWPPRPFVSPLETAATGVVLGHYPVLKPNWACRDFLSVEHGHPTFLRYVNQWPLRAVPGPLA